MIGETYSWIENIPSGWESKRLKDLFSFGSGLSISKDNLVEKGVSVISYGQIHAKFNTGVSIDDRLLRYVSPSFLETGSSSLVKVGDFIFADTSEDVEGCGNCIYIDRDMPLFAGYHTVILRSPKRGNNKYLAYLFQSDNWRGQIRSKVCGVKLFSITKSILNGVKVILPPINEQEKIVSYLDEKIAAINATIAARNEELKLLKKFKQAKINEVVIKGVRSNSPLKECEVSWVGNIPEHWSVRRIKDIFYESAEVSVTGTEELLSVSEYYGVAPRKDKMNDDEEFETRADSLEGYKICHRGDLVSNIMLTWKRALGVSQYEGIVSPAYGVYRGINIETRYYHYLFRSDMYIAEFKRNSTGIIDSRLRLYSDRFFAIKTICPPLDEQREIADYLDSECDKIDKKCTLIEQQMEKLQLLKRALINEVVTGKRQLA